jgi:hypothetical protein
MHYTFPFIESLNICVSFLNDAWKKWLTEHLCPLNVILYCIKMLEGFMWPMGSNSNFDAATE